MIPLQNTWKQYKACDAMQSIVPDGQHCKGFQ